MNHLDYKPHPLAISVIRLFLRSTSGRSCNADALANQLGATTLQVRQALAPAVGHEILERGTHDLTGEIIYSAGLRIGIMRGQLPPQDDPEPTPQAVADTPAAVPSTASRTRASRIDLNQLSLVDLPMPTTRIVGSRYEAQFSQALETGQAILMPRHYVGPVSANARHWLIRRGILAKVRAFRNLLNSEAGAIYLLKTSQQETS